MISRYLLLFLLPVFFFKPLLGKEKAKGGQPVIVFDYGGVLATADKGELQSFIAQTFAVPLKEVAPLLKQMRHVRKKIGDEALAWEAVAKERGVVLQKDWMARYQQQKLASIHERPHMMELVRTLKEGGYQVAMLSNVSKREACLVQRLGYYAPFNPVLLSCEIGAEKPNPQAFRILLKRLNKRGREVLFIDDQEQNIRAASKFRIDAILFISYEQLVEELEHRKLLVFLTK